MHLAERLYPRMPIPLQNLACSVYGWREARLRLNRDFEARLAALMETERWSAGEIQAYQDERLYSLVRHAYEEVPFYRERMKARRLHPSDIRTVADLPKLPILTKEDVRLHGEQLVARNAKKKDLVFIHTGGTTGKSLHFYATRPSFAFRWAVWWRHRLRFGVDVKDWHANFTGKLAIPPDQQAPPYWRWNLPMRQILLNMHHMVPGKVETIAEFLGKQDLVYYSGYPSIIHAFARTLIDRGIELTSRPRFVFTGAENMLEDQRRDIAAVTGAVLSDQYGFSEGCGNASHCTELVYHEDFEYGILECVDPSPADTDGNVRGKIVATGFASPGFPFIRYEVGDIGVWADASYRCPCGRESRVMRSIEGRMDDYVITPEGRRIMRFDYIFKDTLSVRESQVLQRRLGEIEVVIVRRPDYSGAEERQIREEIATWISPELEVRFRYVDEIPREINGKFRAVKSLLKEGAAGEPAR